MDRICLSSSEGVFRLTYVDVAQSAPFDWGKADTAFARVDISRFQVGIQRDGEF